MFKFLFGTKGVGGTKETQRQTVERALAEVNDILEAMAEKPKVSVDLNTGALSVELPKQMPDEALALPAPDKSDAKAEEEAPEKEAA